MLCSISYFHKTYVLGVRYSYTETVHCECRMELKDERTWAGSSPRLLSESFQDGSLSCWYSRIPNKRKADHNRLNLITILGSQFQINDLISQLTENKLVVSLSR